MSRPYILVDGLNVFMRHFAANPARSLNGELCGGILGMLKNIQYLIERFHPEKVIVAWEGGGSLRRRNIDSNYKEGRRPVGLNRSKYNDIPETVDNRNNQLKLLIEAINFTPITQVYLNDCEADDIISVVVQHPSFAGWQKVIVSSDKDFFQLCDGETIVFRPIQKQVINQFH